MSSTEQILDQVQLKSDTLQIAASGRYLNDAALEEALNSELAGYVWQITKRKTYADYVEVSYRAVPTQQWELLKDKVCQKQWPLIPHNMGMQLRKARQLRTEIAISAVGIFLFVVLLIVGAMTYRSNADYEAGLRALVAGRTSHMGQNSNSAQWVDTLNNMVLLLRKEGYEVDGFEIDKKGGYVQTTLTDADVFSKINKEFVDLSFRSVEGGYRWSW